MNLNLNRHFNGFLKYVNGHDGLTVRRLKERSKRAGLEFENPTTKNLVNEDIMPYSLRLVFATHLLESGATLKDVSELLGHSSITINANTYLHISDERKATHVDNLENMIFSKLA